MADDQRWTELALEAGRVFNPNTPIDERALFAGRDLQIRRVVDVVNQKGQHAVIFGERRVGKTSLANVLSQFLGHPTGDVLAPRVNCDGADTFDSVWKKVFGRIELIRAEPVMGFKSKPARRSFSSADLLGDKPGADGVTRALTILSRDALPILIIDEFDRLSEIPRRGFADTIKSLSDHAVSATVILVGVADSVDQLIQEHQSVARALVQIPMPRMSPSEISQIVSTGLSHLGMTIDDHARRRIVLLAQGLPHYAHLIGLHASRAALDSHSTSVSVEIVNQAIAKAIEDAQQSIRNAYYDAIRSPRKDNLFADVLLACALAKTNELGYFAAQDVRQPIRGIVGKNYDIPTFAQHLNEFSEIKRGRILQKTGDKRRYRYRFSDPLMQPYVIMQGVVGGKVPAASIESVRGELDL